MIAQGVCSWGNGLVSGQDPAMSRAVWLREGFGTGRDGARSGQGAETSGRAGGETQVWGWADGAGAAGERGAAGAGFSRSVLRGRGLPAGPNRVGNSHRPGMAGGAAAQGLASEGLEAVAVVGGLVGRRGSRGHVQQSPAQGEVLLAAGSGEKTEMPNAVEAWRQRMHQEAPDELGGGE